MFKQSIQKALEYSTRSRRI